MPGNMFMFFENVFMFLKNVLMFFRELVEGDFLQTIKIHRIHVNKQKFGVVKKIA